MASSPSLANGLWVPMDLINTREALLGVDMATLKDGEEWKTEVGSISLLHEKITTS